MCKSLTFAQSNIILGLIAFISSIIGLVLLLIFYFKALALNPAINGGYYVGLCLLVGLYISSLLCIVFAIAHFTEVYQTFWCWSKHEHIERGTPGFVYN
jgi:hypothetical protein